MSVVVVVPGPGAVADQLASLAEQEVPAAEVDLVLVDTSGGTAAHAPGTGGPAARTLSVDRQRSGEAAAIGTAAARTPNVVVLDGPSVLAPGLLAVLLGRPAGPGPQSLGERLDLVRGLTALVAGTAEVRRRRDRALAEQVAWIRRLIDDDPAQHRIVVAEARARAVHDLPWSEINRGRARDLAVLYCFVPYIDTSGLVAARRLREWGVVTDVVSQNLGNVAKVDEAAMRIPAEVLDQTRVVPGKRRAGLWESARGFVEDTVAAVAELEAEKGPYRSLYSRAMAPASHLAAAVLKLRSPDLHWVAEFSDPVLMDQYGERRAAPDVPADDADWLLTELRAAFEGAGVAVPDTNRLWGWAESVVYAFADEIIYTNQHQQDLMLGYCADRSLADRAAGIARVMHHPVPGADLYRVADPVYPLAPGKVHLGYFGNFYRNRGLSEVIDALDALPLAERDRVQLHIFTSKPARLTLDIVERGLADVVRISPMFGYLEYLNLSTRFDVLVLNDYTTRPHYVPNPYLPAKLADYRGSGAKIWGLFEEGSVLSTSDAVDHATPLGDVAAAAEVLHTLLAT